MESESPTAKGGGEEPQATTGFDNERYLAEQSAAILERAKETQGNKLYLEFGGKLIFDYHAARVLPGYDPNVKMRLLQRLVPGHPSRESSLHRNHLGIRAEI